MADQFWFGFEPPHEFRDPAVRPLLSFNGQLHFGCRSCEAVVWVDVPFAGSLLNGGSDVPCPACRQPGLDLVKFAAFESRLCRTCGLQSLAAPGDPFDCAACHDERFTVEATLIHPNYPSEVLVLLSRNVLGQSVADDVKFLVEYIRGLRFSPEFHQASIHFVAFIESLFEHVYRSSVAAVDLLNVASGIMREVYRESGDLDAAYLSIAMMVRGRDVTESPAQRAVFGLNICQNVYSVLAQGHEELVSLRLRQPLKPYGVALARETLAAFEEIDEDWLAELRARTKWLLGDMLKAGRPSESEIDEALRWFDAALRDRGLPREVAGHVRESATSANAKRRNLSPAERAGLDADLVAHAKASLDATVGLKRLQSLNDILRGQSGAENAAEREAAALRCLGEAVVYAAGNDPNHMLRHAGTHVSRLVAGYAAERFDAGMGFDALVGVEGFRSLAIHYGARAVHALELKLKVGNLLGSKRDVLEIAETLLSEQRTALVADLQCLVEADPDRLVLWCETWEGKLYLAKVVATDGELELLVGVHAVDAPALQTALDLPMADAELGPARTAQVAAALEAGWATFKPFLRDEPSDRSCLVVGPSALGTWPVDAAEALAEGALPRPMSFAPTIGVAAAALRAVGDRTIQRVLAVPYGGQDLPGARQEMQDLEAIYGARLTRLDSDGLTRAEVLQALSEAYDVIHFSGHGTFDYLDPMQACIHFQGPDGADGVVTAADILTCGTVGRAPIVVLCACTSAAVMPNGANNFLGLAGALIRSGATSIIGARWPISDRAAVAFSRAFHEALSEGLDAPHATAAAKALLLDQKLDDWSAFMAIGA